MDFNAIMKQAKKMQQEMTQKEDELHNKIYEASVSGGAVKVVLTGRTQIESVEIEEDLLSKDNKEILQDMIQMAVNNALADMNKDKEESLKELNGGINLPGMF